MRYSVKQVAQLWGVSPHTVYNLLERRELSCVRIGRTVRLRDEDLQEYEQRRCQTANDNAPESRRQGPRPIGDVVESIVERIRR
jgi:excisionase family DNA binding protein